MTKGEAIECGVDIQAALSSLRRAKPTERSELARRFAVTLTMMEQASAYFMCYVLASEELADDQPD